MKWISYDLKMLFQSGYALKADLFTFTLVDGTVLTFTSFDISLTSPRNGLVYSSAFEQVERSKISWKNDLSVSTMELTINIQTQYQVENMSFL